MTELVVGTRKGIFVVTHDGHRQTWTVGPPMFLGHIAQHVVQDHRVGGLLLAAMSTGHLGPTVFRSADGGATWTEASRPPAFRSGERLARAVHAVFWLRPDIATSPVCGLSSPVGLDGGNDWLPLNLGCQSPMHPDTEMEFGHDPHCVRMHPLRPDRLYQQNHCGIYRIDRPGDRWVRVGDNMPAEVGHIGFPIELHPGDPDTAWVFPMDGTDVWPRTSPDGRPAVYRTRDASAAWVRSDAGLPAPAWFTVKRRP